MLSKYFNRSIGLSALRVIIAFIVIKKAIFILPMAEEIFGVHSIAPLPGYLASLGYYHVPFLYFPFDMAFGPQLFLLLTIAAGLLFLFGEFSIFPGIALYWLILVAKMRNGFILDGSDNVIHVILPFLILADSYRYFRLGLLDGVRLNFQPGWWEKVKPHWLQFRKVIHEVALIGLLVQVCFVYFFTALAKLQGELWLNGTAIYYTMRVEEFLATKWNIPLTSNHYFVVLATYGTVLWEVAFAFLIWFRQTRYFVILGGIMLHLGIWFFMRIDDFSWVMMATYLAFITNAEYHRLHAFFTRERLTLLYDNWCPRCISFARIMQKADLLGNLKFVPMRDERETYAEVVDYERAEQAMPSINRSGQVVYGFDTLYRLCLSLPLLWPAAPVMLALRVTGVGRKVYHKIAISRELLHCSPEGCRIPADYSS